MIIFSNTQLPRQLKVLEITVGMSQAMPAAPQKEARGANQ